LLVLISFSSFAQFEAGEYINSDTVKIDGVPLLLNTFKKDSLGGAGNIFYSTGASSQPASGTVNQVAGGGLLTANYVPKWDGGKFANSVITEVDGKIGINRQNPSFFDISTEYNGIIATTALRLQDSYLDNGWFGVQLRAYDNGVDGHDFIIEGRNSAVGNFTPYFFMRNTGYFGINTTMPSERFDVNGNLIADVLKSRTPTGTPPLVVASSTKVDSLNVGLLDGKKASDFQLKSDTLTFDATLSDLADSSAAIRALANTKASVSGTDNYIMKKTGANTLGNSNLKQSSTTGDIGIGIEPNRTLHIALNGQPTFALSDTRGGTDQQEMGFLYDAGFALTRPGMVYQKLGNDGAFRQNLFTLFQNGTINFDGIAYPDSNTVVFGAKKIGAGTNSPAARIHSQSTGTQARLGYDENKYTDLSTESTGNLTIDPTGDTVKVVGAVNSTGGFFKNGVEITGGGGGSMVYPGAGIPISTGSAWGTSIADNSTNWTSGYNNQIISMTITGTTTKQIQLNQIDGGHIYGSFTDLSDAAWVTDTYGINYSAGKVGIGIGSASGNLLTVGDGSTNTKTAIKASSLNERAIYAISSSNTAIAGQGGLDGVYGVGTRYGVQGASVNGNGIRGASTNAAGISGTSTYSYGGEFSGLGVNISSGGLLINGTTRISSTGTFTPSNGASGSFTSADGKTITVTNGIITGIN
jgi:hypothetical protein